MDRTFSTELRPTALRVRVVLCLLLLSLNSATAAAAEPSSAAFCLALEHVNRGGVDTSGLAELTGHARQGQSLVDAAPEPVVADLVILRDTFQAWADAVRGVTPMARTFAILRDPEFAGVQGRIADYIAKHCGVRLGDGKYNVGTLASRESRCSGWTSVGNPMTFNHFPNLPDISGGNYFAQRFWLTDSGPTPPGMFAVEPGGRVEFRGQYHRARYFAYHPNDEDLNNLKTLRDIDLDPDAEVQITAGATEAIAATMLSLLEIGDEVVTFEPWYDSYGASIAMAGGVKRVVTLRPPEYAYDGEAFERVITPKTRLVLLNTPHNPTGKVFTRTELEHIAEVCVRHDLIVVTDEVYEHLVFDGEHIPLATLPGMRERTLTISSVGKTFSFTGWKTGWVSGPESLVTAVRTAKQFLTFVSSAAWQHGAAVALDLDDDYYRDFTADMAVKRAVLCAGLTASGLTVHEPQGTYFVNTDIRSLSGEDGADFCLALPERVGVVGVPTQVFYDNVHEGRHLVRFTFCKRIEVLEEASMRLAGLRQTMEADR